MSFGRTQEIKIAPYNIWRAYLVYLLKPIHLLEQSTPKKGKKVKANTGTFAFISALPLSSLLKKFDISA